MKSPDGREIDLADYEGKVVMIVNVASKYEYTPQ
jgi:glutathione peroxidase-family protein